MLCLVLFATPSDAQIPLPVDAAQSAPNTLPTPLTPEAARDLMATLSETQVRTLLLERLDAVAAADVAQAERAPFGAFLRSYAEAFEASVRASVLAAPNVLEGLARAGDAFAAPRGADGVVWLVAWLVGALLAGAALEALYRRLGPVQRAITATAPPQPRFRTQMGVLARRFLADAGGLLVFLLGVLVFLEITVPRDTFNAEQPNANRALIWFTASVPLMVVRLTALVTRTILAPERADRRFVHLTDDEARTLHRNIVIFAALLGAATFIIAFSRMHGMQPDELRVRAWLDFIVYGWAIWALWSTREAITRLLCATGDEPTPGQLRIARIYPWFAVLVIAMAWVHNQYLGGIGAFHLLYGRTEITLALIFCAPVSDFAIRRLVHHLVPPMRGEGRQAEAAYRSTKRSYVRIGRVVVITLVIVAVASLWDIDLGEIAPGGAGALVATRLLDAAFALAVGYLLWELVSLWINRKLAAERTALVADAEEPGGGEGGGIGGSRLSTVLPLALGIARVAIVVVLGLVTLRMLGVDTTPLLAGAGIVGLAIGFGAQKLVADVVSGAFFLIDDAFRVGEYLDIEGTVGTVERISIRSMQLRHHRGPVHTIPYGGITKITNFSRDWVIMKLKFTVPFDTDPHQVKKIFRKIGADMMAVPEFASDMLQPFKSQGVFDFDDVGMIIRGKFMAKPGKQFTLRKEVYNRVKAAFQEHGIEFARREVRVAIPGFDGADTLTGDQKKAVSAAAGDAVREMPT
ncbi:MAG: mechanosensitive ion channel domain-containing protein [Pseudomonadota bacterium]